MKRFTNLVAAFAMLLTGGAITTSVFTARIAPVPAPTAAAKSSGVKWYTSFSAAQKEAKRTGKPLLVDFSATWCQPCHMLANQTFKDKAVMAHLKKFVTVKVDVDRDQNTSQRYGIQALPTVIAMKPNGKGVSKFIGFQDAKTTVKFLQSAHTAARKK